jgi:hypothetical protein
MRIPRSALATSSDVREVGQARGLRPAHSPASVYLSKDAGCESRNPLARIRPREPQGVLAP